MAKQKAKLVTKRQKDAASRAFLKAAGRWVEVNGGRALVGSGFRIFQYPGESAGNFHVSVKITGRKPVFEKAE